MVTRDARKNNTAQSFAGEYFFHVLLLCALFFVTPFFPDVQVIRPKLFVFEIGLFAVVFCYIIKVLYAGRFEFRKTPLNIPIATYIIYVLLVYLAAGNKFVAASELKRMVLCSGVFFLAANMPKRDSERMLLLSCWAAGSAWAVVYGILQSTGGAWIFQVPKMTGRVYSTFGNPIFFAAHIVMFLPLVFALFFTARNFFLRTALLAAFISGLYALYLTQTRAAFLGFAASMLFFYAACETQRGWIMAKYAWKRKFLFAVLLAALVLSGFALYRTNPGFNAKIKAAAATVKNIATRQQAHPLIWRDTLRMWLSKPVFGVGPGTFHINFPKFASKELLEVWPQKTRIINDAHNEYVQILAETGIVGLGVFLWIIAAFFMCALRALRAPPGGGEQKTTLPLAVTGLVSSCAAILVQNFFSVDMRFIFSSIYLFLAMGIVCSSGEKTYSFSFALDRNLKHALALALCFASGVIGAGPGAKLHIAGFLHFDLSSGRVYARKSDEGTGLLPRLIKPYIAQQKLDSEPDFFDEKVLEPLKTIADLQDALKKYPGEPRVYERIAWVYAKEKNFPPAIEYFRKALALDPKSFAAYNNLGNIFFLLNDRQQAIENYRKSIEINSGQVDAHVNLGIVYYYEARLKEAADEFEKVLKLDPKNEKAIVMLKRMRE